MNKIVNVDNTELEALKQLAMEMALRLNVLQGESLLNEKPVERKVWPVKREANENKVLVGKIVMVVSFFLGSLIATVCGAGNSAPLGAIAGMVVGLGVLAVYYKATNRGQLEATK